MGDTGRSRDRDAAPEMTYFELQAYMGTTKHMGGLDTTRELMGLCQVDGDSYVLEVGCGVGATACYLAETYGCRVVGVDLRESMVDRARERAEREGVAGLVAFRVADARTLPFEEATFDLVFCESVITFIEDKAAVAGEFARVLKPGGRVGLNEEIWHQPPPPGMLEEVQRIWEVERSILSADGWRDLLERAGLREVVVRPYAFDARREATQVKRYTLGDMVRMFSRTVRLYLNSADFRTYMRGRRRLPKDIWDYLGYALFVGRK